MKLLYISSLVSCRLFNEISLRANQAPAFAVQKFGRLMVEGFSKNDCDITALSNPGITSQNSNKVFVRLMNETEYGINYKYVPFINIPFVKHLCVFVYIFFYVLFFGFSSKKKAIVCDVLSISACMATLLACKINRVHTIGVVTDIYGQMEGNDNEVGAQGLLVRISSWLNSKYIKSFSSYVFLTEQMNDLINKNNRPYIVMEGLCDNTVTDEQIQKVEKATSRIILYAGSLHEKYGLKLLVDAFVQLNLPNSKLVIYGDGPYVPELKIITEMHQSVEYRGTAPNNEVVKAELEATLLVNPRPTTEEFTKYSFPSKNMEYMTTGTPLLTTKLPGMPDEYHQYVYLIEEESVDGYASALESAMNHSAYDMTTKGRKARDFVIFNKNNKQQTARILTLVK